MLIFRLPRELPAESFNIQRANIELSNDAPLYELSRFLSAYFAPFSVISLFRLSILFILPNSFYPIKLCAY